MPIRVHAIFTFGIGSVHTSRMKCDEIEGQTCGTRSVATSTLLHLMKCVCGFSKCFRRNYFVKSLNHHVCTVHAGASCALASLLAMSSSLTLKIIFVSNICVSSSFFTFKISLTKQTVRKRNRSSFQSTFTERYWNYSTQSHLLRIIRPFNANWNNSFILMD